MKPVALLSVCVILLFGTSLARAQAFRGSAGGGGSATMSMPSAATGRSATAPVASGVVTGQAVQGSQGFRGTSAPPTIQASPGFQNRGFSSPPRTIPSHRGGGVFVPSPFIRSRPPFFILGSVPFHLHRHWFFHRHPGLVFFDVPYVVGTNVITQVAPGVLQAERRYFDESPSDARIRIPGQLAPFDPTPQEVVERMLVLAAVKKGDVVYDLGSGDGRILITAAKKYGARGVGFEIDPGLVKLARENARKQGVEKLVEIRQQDFLTADLSPASVVTLYLSYDGNMAVRPQLMRQLKPDARVVSYAFDMGEWQPKISEAYRDAAGDEHWLYLWQLGAPMVFSDNFDRVPRTQSMRDGPLIIDVE
jgi:precorrin-6B methylase 2